MAIANRDVEAALRSCLETEGYTLSTVRKNGYTGVDVLAEKADDEIFIEVIGFKDSKSARSRDFYEVFFRAISRLNEGATRLVIALPERFSWGLPQRAAVYGPAWIRLGMAFPELEVWLVNHEEPSYRRTTWTEWFPSRSHTPRENK